MDNMIPLNGRIAIVDDKINQALPLMRVLSKNNIPYTFYQGNNVDFLPEQCENDIRILFLDLNLLGGRDLQPKDIRGTLHSTLIRIISPNNYPYVLILWSRQENEYRVILEDLFINELKECAPIAIKNYVKSDFFPNFAEDEDTSQNDDKILEELKNILKELLAYSYLIQWENCVHNSADATIQDVFHDHHSKNDWKNNANCIMNMFARSYLEKRFDDSSDEEKAKASLLFLNDVFQDTLEASISDSVFSYATDLSYSVSEEDKIDIAANINECLLLSGHYGSVHQPGCVLNIENTTENVKHFHEIFNDAFNRNGLSSKEIKSLKKNVYDFLIPCEVVVTPACDYAQGKFKNDRIVQSIIIDAAFRSYIDQRSEAIFTSPVFKFSNRHCVMVLNLRYFITKHISDTGVETLFRIRETVLTEIQSKLARHISRQGIMNL